MERFRRHTAISGPWGYPPWASSHSLAHPAHIRQVLQDQPDAYRKEAGVARIKPLFGEGLTTSEGSLWQRQRQLMQPLFQWRRVLPWMDVTAEATAVMLARWEPFAARGQPVELATALQDLTQSVMHQILFGLDIRPDAQAVGQLDRGV
jgi:cytochrome P450